jgi:hypothetical protein
MPERTNEFQKIVDIIQRLYAPKDAIITTSAMITPSSGGAPREVDILIEFKTDLYPFKVAVEAKDFSRAIDVTGIEVYGGKYNSNGGIVVNKVIIVAHSFTEAAKQRANDLGFSLHTIHELESGIEGLFSEYKSKPGYWWLSPEKPNNEVKAILYDKYGGIVPLASIITPRTSKVNLGSAKYFAQLILDRALGKIASDLYSKNAGKLIHLIIEVYFPDHKARIGKKAVKLKKMSFDFGKRMRLPYTKAKEYEMKTESNSNKNIIIEKGIANDSSISITYEKREGHPDKFFLNHESTVGNTSQIEKIVISMNLEETLSKVVIPKS